MKKFNKKIVIVAIFSVVLGLTGSITAIAAGPSLINLGTAGNYTILAKTGISTTGTTYIIGDIGVSPSAATYITGFGLILPAASSYATSSLITGKVYAPGYADPTPANITTAIGDMENAYTTGAGMTNPTATELGAGNIGGMTLAPGLYKWSTGLTIPTDVTLSGGDTDVWVFQIAQNLDISSAAKVILAGGAQARNIFWVVAGQTTLGTTSVFNGNILDQTSIILNTGAILNGRALAQTAVTLDSNSVTIPSGSSIVPVPTQVVVSTNTSGSYTATVAQNYSNPVTITVAPGITMTVSSNGCSSGNKYNTSNGQLCVNNITILPGCSGENKYNTANGQLCVNNIVGNKYNFGNTTLKQGSTGEGVMELQKFLNAKLNLGLVVDGKLGKNTIAVIKQWQKDNGLVDDGLVGAKTKVKMNSMAF